MNNTPLTDALIDRLYDDDNGGDEHLLMHWQTVEMNDHARALETRLARLEEIAEGMAESIQRGGIVAAQECRLNATYHIRIMKEALAAYRAFREETAAPNP